MITAVDTNVLLDVLGGDPAFGVRSARALQYCMNEGVLVACAVVWAEVASVSPSPGEAKDALDRLGVAFSPMNRESALAAATAWKSYRSRGGRQERVVADFLIGSHGRLQADRLLTRDRGFYRTYFAGLTVIDPAQD